MHFSQIFCINLVSFNEELKVSYPSVGGEAPFSLVSFNEELKEQWG